MEKEIKIKKLDLNGGLKDGTFNDLEQVRINDDFTQLNTIKETVDTAPTYVPKNFTEQEVYYVNGATYRKYFYIQNSWRYITLT